LTGGKIVPAGNCRENKKLTGRRGDGEKRSRGRGNEGARGRRGDGETGRKKKTIGILQSSIINLKYFGKAQYRSAIK